MSKQQLASYTKVSETSRANCYVVVDIGGGTVDICAHLLSDGPDRHMTVVHPPAGNDCGGSRVNQEFSRFLENLVEDAGFSQYISTGSTVTNAAHKADLNELVNDTFEIQKRIFGNKQDSVGRVSVRLPYSFMECYRGKVDAGIQKLGDDRIKLSGTELRIDFAKIAEFFKPVVDGVLKCMSNIFEKIEEEIETVYLVGGFGGCHYMYTMISEHFEDVYKYVTPAEPDYAVVRGAVIYRNNPEVVESRRADATYGVRASIPFNADLHDEAYKQTIAGDLQCTNIFSTFVERGDIVRANEVMVKTYKPESARQASMHINIYSSPEKDVWYTTGKRPKQSSTQAPVDVFKVGELVIPLQTTADSENPQGEDQTWQEREIELTFDFSHTEIQVKGFDYSTNTEVKVVLDFL